ncbi:11331_t:CDS:2 [Entrophospora sp. SA101]|nr:11331_t:CDS:2 [Entrophospora sp. SA101]
MPIQARHVKKLVDKFGIGKSNVGDILRDKEKWLAITKSSADTKRDPNYTITGSIICQKALDYARRLEIIGFYSLTKSRMIIVATGKDYYQILGVDRKYVGQNVKLESTNKRTKKERMIGDGRGSLKILNGCNNLEYLNFSAQSFSSKKRVSKLTINCLSNLKNFFYNIVPDEKLCQSWKSHIEL